MSERPKSINVTFKQKELYMYEILKEKSSPSAFIKDLIKKELRSNEEKK